MSRQPPPNATVAAGNKDTSDFFSRHGLPPLETRNLCWDFIKTKYSGDGTNIKNDDIHEAPNQGFCSYTLFLSTRPETIVQFRTPAHELKLDIVNAAKEIYGGLVAVTELIGCLIIHSSKQDVNSPVLLTSLPRNHDPSNGGKTPDPSLLVYSLSRIHGISLAELYTAPYSHHSLQCQYHRQEALVKAFADIISQGLLSSPSPGHSVPKGPVGSTIRHRLEMMQRELPIRFRPTVDTILDALPKVEALPWVLTHGDLVPSNVIIDFCCCCCCCCCSCSSEQKERCSSQPPEKNNTKPARQPSIRGLIDWAEAEYFPFGVGIYGLEEFLGVQQFPMFSTDKTDPDPPHNNIPSLCNTPPPPPPPIDSNITAAPNSGKKYPPPASRFHYFPEAETLRALFWTELEARIRGAPESCKTFLLLHTAIDGDKEQQPTTLPPDNTDILETVRLARTLGILLWHGIAFDDGRLDRVICEGRDDEEIQRLDLHLHLQSSEDRTDVLNGVSDSTQH